MRTTVTLEPDVAALIERVMSERGIGFKQAVNEALRAGLARDRAPFRQQTMQLGRPSVDLDRALRLAGELEDEALVDKLSLRK
jgi:hypothetical protein